MANLEKSCCWHFAEQAGGREDGPNNPMDGNFKKTPYASLIRESIQNSLDAALDDNQPVQVNFEIGRIRANEYERFFELKGHIQGCIDHYPSNDDAKETYNPMIEYLTSMERFDNLYYIKVSDFNTKGMNYKNRTQPDYTSEPFYAFVRAAGVSSKNDSSAGGSFGFGKAAYFYISPLRTILVSTKTQYGTHFFEGVASLCTHRFMNDGKKYVAVGYYDNNDGEPITKYDDIPEKFKRDETGTDIFIMGLKLSKDKEEANGEKTAIYKEMIEAVLRNFWLAIEFGKLEVKVEDTIINKENLPTIMEEYFPDKEDTKRRERQYNPRPYWEAVHNKECDRNHVYIEKTYPKLGLVKFYGLKVRGAQDKILYMRRLHMLVKARRTQSANGIYGLFLCDSKFGNKILRNTENPAHNEWAAGNWQIDGKKAKDGIDAIEEVDRFIIDVLEEIFAGREKNVQQIQGLEEFLYIPTEPTEDDDLDNDSLTGEPVDESDDGNSMSTELSDPIHTPIEGKTELGKVLISDTSAYIQRDEHGNVLSGHGIRKRRNQGGGGTGTRNIDGRYKSEDKGVNGEVLHEIPVTYRSFAQKINDRVFHTLVIHSEYEVEKGRIDLMVGGEQSDDVINIEYCSKGDVRDNTISNLTISKGKNLLTIRFADNMKHAVKLDAYESK